MVHLLVLVVVSLRRVKGVFFRVDRTQPASFLLQKLVEDCSPSEFPSPVSDGVYYSDQLIEFTAQVSDAEDIAEDLSVQWVSTMDGELFNVASTPNNSGEVVGFGNLTEGQHAIQLFVTDTTGKETQESVIIDVVRGGCLRAPYTG